MKILKMGALKTDGTAAEPVEERDPIPGIWYHGLTPHGAGALVQYVGWGRFINSDDQEVTMDQYPVIVEHK